MTDHLTLEEKIAALTVEVAESRTDHKHLDECVDETKRVMNDRFDKTSAKIDRLFDKLDTKIDKLNAAVNKGNATTAWGFLNEWRVWAVIGAVVIAALGGNPDLIDSIRG